MRNPARVTIFFVVVLILALSSAAQTGGATEKKAAKPGTAAKTAVPASSAGAAMPAKTPATKAATESEGPIPKIEYEKYTLSNGLQVILHVDRKLPMVNVNTWYHVGSKNEKVGRTGFAHLFEHMMFQGSANSKDKYLGLMERAGANLHEGGVNGTTNTDRTNYFETVPAQNLEFVLWAESDRLATLTDGIDQAKLDNQRDVVKNERRQGLENQPYGRAFKLMVETVFPAGHPYSWSVIGSHEDLTAASLNDVKDFFHQYYTPNNLSLVIAGDFDLAEAKRLIAKYFGPIPAGPALDRPHQYVPPMNETRVVEVSDRVPQERVYMAWPTPQYFTTEDADLDLLQLLLSDGLSSRLQKALVYDKQLCSNVGAFQWNMEIAGVFVIQATARPGVALSKVEAAIDEELARMEKTGPTEAELKRAKEKQEYTFVTGLERIGGFGGKADLLNMYNTFVGDPGKIADDIHRYRSATPARIQATAQKWITSNRAIIRFHPEGSGRGSEVAIDRSKVPALGADKVFQAPEVKTAKLKNGLEVYVVERPELPKVAVTVATRAGSIGDLTGKEGTAVLLMRTVDRGTKTRNALQISDSLGDLGTDLSGYAGRETSRLSFEVLKRNLAPALDIAADVLCNATFPDAEVERERKRQLDALSQEFRNPNALASRVSAILAFGPDHPYGRPRTGRPASVGAITAADVREFHDKWWKPGNSALIFAGDITLAEATRLAERAFGSWSGAAPEPIAIPQPKPVSGKVYLIDRQDAAQTVVAQILPGPARTTPDYYSLRLADAVWGGGFGTRLNLNLRESKGYSYGVFSTPELYGKAGLWRAGGGVQTNKTKESVVEFVNELDAIGGRKPITEAELADARANLVRGYAQGFESLGSINGRIASLWGYGLPMSELQREAEEMQKTGLADVNATAQKYLLHDKSTLLLVGDRAKIEAGIRELKLGDIEVVDQDGKPVATAVGK